MASRAWLWALAGLLTLAGPARAAALPAEFQAKLLVRVLPYDRTLAERTKSMRVAVLFQPGNADSEAAATALVAQVGRVAPGKRIQGQELAAEKLAFAGKTDLEARAKATAYAAFVLAPGLAGHTAAIAAVARARGALTIGTVRQNVKAGAAVALVSEDDSPKIVVNKAASQAAGAAFSDAFLSLAEVMD